MSGRLIKREGERGAALVVCLLVMAVLALLGAAMITNSVLELKLSGNQRASKTDFYAADGGVRLLVTRLSDPTQTVGNVAQIDVPNQTLAPNATETEDPHMPGWVLAQGASPWGGPQPFAYHYRVIYLHKGNPPKGYSVGAFAGYYYQVDCMSGDTGVSTINMKIGPK
jgi:Tfp pilus assembly protein PilX